MLLSTAHIPPTAPLTQHAASSATKPEASSKPSTYAQKRNTCATSPEPGRTYPHPLFPQDVTEPPCPYPRERLLQFCSIPTTPHLPLSPSLGPGLAQTISVPASCSPKTSSPLSFVWN